MKIIWQGLLICVFTLVVGTSAWSQGNDKKISGKYKKPTVNLRLLGNELSMVGSERDDYATNLAAYAVKVVQGSKGDQKSLDLARGVLGLGLHLSPRNKKCVVVNGQLARGIMPETLSADYDSEVFASLLLERGLVLGKNDQKVNQTLARYFIELAATIDPHNEDAIYEAELKRLDQGELSWKLFTDSKAQ